MPLREGSRATKVSLRTWSSQQGLGAAPRRTASPQGLRARPAGTGLGEMQSWGRFALHLSWLPALPSSLELTAGVMMPLREGSPTGPFTLRSWSSSRRLRRKMNLREPARIRTLRSSRKALPATRSARASTASWSRVQLATGVAAAGAPNRYVFEFIPN